MTEKFAKATIYFQEGVRDVRVEIDTSNPHLISPRKIELAQAKLMKAFRELHAEGVRTLRKSDEAAQKKQALEDMKREADERKELEKQKIAEQEAFEKQELERLKKKFEPNGAKK